MIIHPYNMEAIDWFDSMAFLLTDIPTRRIENLDNWQEWARNLTNSPDLLGQNTPNPYTFNDWREWAMRLFVTIEFGG